MIKDLKEYQSRSVVKALSHRVFGTATTIVIVLVFTGDFALSAGVGGVEILAKLLVFFLHERLWAHIPWGYRS